MLRHNRAHKALETATMFKRLRTGLATWVPALAPALGGDDGGGGGDDDPYTAFGNRSVGFWDADRGLAVVQRPRGKQLRTVGVTVGGGDLALFGEETLYLVERGALVLLGSAGDPRSALPTRDAYDRVLARGGGGGGGEDAVAAHRARCPLHCYWAYAHLRALGYAVFRRDSLDLDRERDGAAAAPPTVWAGDDGPVPFSFVAYEATGNFSKRRPGAPAFYVFVALNGGFLPSVRQLAALVAAAGGVPVKACVVAGDGTVLLFDITAGVPSLD